MTVGVPGAGNVSSSGGGAASIARAHSSVAAGGPGNVQLTIRATGKKKKLKKKGK